MSGPFRETPAQAAGLIGGGATDDDRKLWDEFKRSPQAEQIRKETAAKRLARRRELVAKREAEHIRLQKAAEEIDRQKRQAAQRLEKTEREFHAALKHARALPLFPASDSQLLADIARELHETADPRILQLQEWLSRESQVTRCHGAPFIANDYGGGGGFDQRVQADLVKRQSRITEALQAVRELPEQALTDEELTGELERILGLVPPIPAGASLQAPLPRPLTLNGSAPTAVQQQHEARIAAVGAEQQRIAAQTPKRWRK
jgi:hypothetical protein